jgi:hypothetical protein
VRIGHGRFSCSFYPVPFGYLVTHKKNRGETIPRHLYNTRRNGVLRAKRPQNGDCVFETASGVVKADGDDDAKIQDRQISKEF